MPTDRELIERWLAGDRVAAGMLVDRYFADVRAYFRLRMAHDYEDLVQDTYARLVRCLPNFRFESSFRTYLFRIARNVLAEALRRRYRADFDPITTSLLDVVGHTQSTLMIEIEHLRILLDSLQALPSADQDLLELYFFQRMPARELGVLFEVSEGAIRSRIRTSLERLRGIYHQIAARPHAHDLDVIMLGRWMLELREHVGFSPEAR